MMGVTLAGLAEGMALADRAGLQQKDVLEVLELTGLACPILLNKGKSIIDGGFPTHQPLQHMQKDLKLSLNMGDTLEQPLPLTASANEVMFLYSSTPLLVMSEILYSLVAQLCAFSCKNQSAIYSENVSI